MSWYNSIVLLLQYLKLKRKGHKSAKEWMADCEEKQQNYHYKEYDRKITEQFIHGLDEGIVRY